jgi:hypothetical protein
MIVVLVTAFLSPARIPTWLGVVWSVCLASTVLGIIKVLGTSMIGQRAKISEKLRQLGFQELDHDPSQEPTERALRQYHKHMKDRRYSAVWRACWRGIYNDCACTVRLSPEIVIHRHTIGCCISVDVEPNEQAASFRPFARLERFTRSGMRQSKPPHEFEHHWHVQGTPPRPAELMTEAARNALISGRLATREGWTWSDGHLFLYLFALPSDAGVKTALDRVTTVAKAAGINMAPAEADPTPSVK